MNIDSNKFFYDQFWSNSRLFLPSHWGHWNILKNYDHGRILEVGPGNKPKIKIKGNYFVDISESSLKRLNKFGGKVFVSDLQEKLPFDDSYFDTICSFETIEHLPNDKFFIKEMSRLLKRKGNLFISFPINNDIWNEYDVTVGHFRRYEVSKIESFFGKPDLKIVEYAFLPVPWPSKVSGKFLSLLSKVFPRFLSYSQDILDSLPASPLRRRITLTPWGRGVDVNKSNTTILLHLKKL